MPWYQSVSYFFGGAFLVNALPHLGTGVAGRPFQSPFSKPPGKGLSSSTVNVLWGFINLVVAYVLLCRVGAFDLHSWTARLPPRRRHPAHVSHLAYGFGRFHGGDLKS